MSGKRVCGTWGVGRGVGRTMGWEGGKRSIVALGCCRRSDAGPKVQGNGVEEQQRYWPGRKKHVGCNESIDWERKRKS